MSDVKIIVSGAHKGINSSVLCELMANFLHLKGLQVELTGEPATTQGQAPKAVEICQETTSPPPTLNSVIPPQLTEKMDELEGSFEELDSLLDAVIYRIEEQGNTNKAIAMLYGIHRLMELLSKDYSQLHSHLIKLSRGVEV